MSNFFDSVLVKKPQKSRFDLSHDVKTSADFAYLQPVLCKDTLPGDTWKISSELFLRAMPLVSPVMHNVNAYVYHFFVPYRIVWRKFNDFLRGGKDNKTEYNFPRFRVTPSEYNTYIAHRNHLGDYFGMPKFQDTIDPSSTTTFDVNALPFIAYHMIYENYFADQQLEDLFIDDIIEYISASDSNAIITSSSSITITTITGVQHSVNLLDWLTSVRTRCWEHDYFTSALPNTQRGDDVHLPIYGTAPLQNYGANPSQVRSTSGESLQLNDLVLGRNNGSNALRGYNLGQIHDNKTVADIQTGERGVGYYNNNGTWVPLADSLARVDVTSHTRVNLTEALGATINDLREAIQLQKYNEIIQRSGNRIKEWLKGVFGVFVSDQRLDLPEYLGGGKAPMVISEVLQQSETTASSPQGAMAGRAVSASMFSSKKFFCEEHGVVISLMSIMPRSAYMQGVPKMFTRFDRFDFGLPIFAHLGEQAVLNQELYLADDGDNEGTFGYLPRFAEYKTAPSVITGDMRDSLDFWHLGRKFASRPTLSKEFVHTDASDMSRIFAVQQSGYQPFVCQLFHHIRVRRPLPYFGTPLL